jgi:hypothetical protein
LLNKRLLRRYAPRNDIRFVFFVIARPAEQAVAISTHKVEFGNKPEGGNPDSRLDITPMANYAERKNLL